MTVSIGNVAIAADGNHVLPVAHRFVGDRFTLMVHATSFSLGGGTAVLQYQVSDSLWVPDASVTIAGSLSVEIVKAALAYRIVVAGATAPSINVFVAQATVARA